MTTINLKDYYSWYMTDEYIEALNSLPEIQGRRVDAHLILGKSYREIARDEGVDKSVVRRSVLCGIESMKKYLRKNL